MEEKRYKYGNRYNLGFLFKVSSIGHAALEQLFGVPEFVEAVENKITEKYNITDEDLFKILDGIHSAMHKENETEGFKEWYKQTYGKEAYHARSWKYRRIRAGYRSLLNETIK